MRPAVINYVVDRRETEKNRRKKIARDFSIYTRATQNWFSGHGQTLRYRSNCCHFKSRLKKKSVQLFFIENVPVLVAA